MENNRETIIMVDDDNADLGIIRDTLSERYSLFTAPSEEELFEILEMVVPSLILLDIEIPGMDGHEIIKKLKNDAKTSNIPIIFLTGKGDTDNELESLSLGAVDYILKPITKELLIKRVDLHIALSRESSINAENERLTLMLDTSPLCTQIWDRNLNTIDCNEAGVRLYGLKSKREYAERFIRECSPEFQPDGQRSDEKAVKLVTVAFEDGYCRFDWLHQVPDTLEPIPAEVTLVRAKYKNDDVVIGYTRDLREHNKLLEGVKRRDRLLEAVNQTATLLLTTKEDENIEKTILASMELIGISTNVDRINIWRCDRKDEKLTMERLYEWVSKPEYKIEKMETYPNATVWESSFSRNEHVGGPVSRLPKDEQDYFTSLNIKSVILIPLFLDEQLWGVFSLDDCKHARYFSEDEIAILRSVSLMMISAENRQTLVENRTRELANQIEERVRIENKMRYFVERSMELSRTLAEITKSPTISSGDLKAAADYIAKVGCNVLNVSRISIWSLKKDEETLVNMSCYDNVEGNFVVEEDFSLIDRDEYSNMLKSERLIITSTKSESHEIEGDYNPNLCAMLEAPVRLDGKTIGLVCADQDCNNEFPDSREWTIEEQSFVSSLSDLMALAISSSERQIAKDEAQAASQAKSDFLANMSHEIRTPMNVIVGLTELLMEGSDPSTKENEYLQKINTAGNTLVGLINDILDISKIEAGKFTILPAQYELASLLNDVIVLSVMRMGDKPITFSLEISGEAYAILSGDDLRIKQVLINLLSNAFKYTRYGTVTLSVNCERGDLNDVWLSFTVTDTGIGMHPEDIEKLFSNYNQVDTRANRMIEGTGLGLAIAKGFVELMGGKITVESEYEKGSKFSFSVKQGYVNGEIIGEKTLDDLRNFRYEDSNNKFERQLKRPDLSWASVLVVDDAPTNLDVAKGLLGKYQMNVDCVTSGHDAIDCIKLGKPVYNAIFMDHMMPGMDGIEAARWIRKLNTEYAKNIPIIALTANAVAGNERLFLEEGFQAFVSKPINVTKLDTAIRRWIMNDNQNHQENQEKQENQETEVNTIPNAQPASPEIVVDIPGVNAAIGLSLYEDDMDMFIGILQSFADNTLEEIDKLRDVTEQSLERYAIDIHTMKGVTGTIGANGLAVRAKKLEEIAIAGDAASIIELNKNYIKDAEKLVDDVRKWLEKNSL